MIGFECKQFVSKKVTFFDVESGGGGEGTGGVGVEWLPSLPSQGLMYESLDKKQANFMSNIGFCGRGKTRVPRGKTSRSREEYQQTQPTNGI